MSETQPFEVRTERLGPLPLVNRFLERLGIEELLEQFVPTADTRTRLSHSKGLGVLLRSILVEREPIYRQQETVLTFAPEAFGLRAPETLRVGDDQIGRSLDHLFMADRAGLLTETIVQAARRFGFKLDELHNDSTSIRFCGQYEGARGRSIRGRRAPWITYGFSKDHRPDLKQLLFILTTTTDGGVPCQFRCADGNTSDANTHLGTWQTLCEVTGRTDFLYVADSKLCTRETMMAIDGKGGRFVTVLPRSRLEDREFREWIQSHEPDWKIVWDRRNPRRKHAPRDVWKAFRYPIPSSEGWPVVWVFSSLLALHQQHSRRERIARAVQDLQRLRAHLEGPRPRLKSEFHIQERIDDIVKKLHVTAYVRAWVAETERVQFRQLHRGRPTRKTRYRKEVRKRFTVAYQIDEEMIAYDQKSDGMYPLLSNDGTLTPAQVLEAHKRQPMVEKRFEQTKTVFELAPVFLKNEGRIEALFFLYFVALLVQALIERELRLGMQREGIEALPLYPERRMCRKPTAETLFRLFSHVQRVALFQAARLIQVSPPQLTDRQKEVLRLLSIPQRVYTSSSE